MIRSLARDVLVTLSAFSVGSALFTAFLCLRMLNANRRRYLSFASAKVGYAVVVGIILFRILLPTRELPPDAWAVGYAVGLGLAGLGFIGVGRTVRREFIAWETERDKGSTFDPEEAQL